MCLYDPLPVLHAVLPVAQTVLQIGNGKIQDVQMDARNLLMLKDHSS